MTPDIYRAMLKAYSDGAFGIDYQVPGDDFTPVVDTPYAKLKFKFNPSSVATQYETGKDQHLGFLQIELRYPLGQGFEQINAKIEEIRQHFKIGTNKTYNTQVVRIDSIAREDRGTVDGWFLVIVTVYFRAYTQRL